MIEIVLGPPGTGKTTTLLGLVDEALKRGVPPDRIGYVTFTRKGAGEAVERACAKFGLERGQLPHFRTLHSLCYQQMGVHSVDMLVGKAFYEFADYARIRVTGRAWSDDGLLSGFEQGDRILFMENLARIRQIPLRQQYEMDSDNLPWREVERVANALVAYKASRGLMDYTDLLQEFVNHGSDIGLEELYVDEAQDLSRLQWLVVALLSRGCKRVVVAGDDDQAIYPWAGADAEHLVTMEGEARVLGRSYRVPPVIQKVAKEIITPVINRRDKAWRARTGGRGVLDRSRSYEEVEVEREGTVLILARNIYVLREQVEPALRRAGVIYELKGKSSVPMEAYRAAITWEDLRASRPVTLGAVREMYTCIGSGTGVRRGFKKLPTFGEDDESPVELADLVQHGGLVANTDLPWHEALDRLDPEDVSYMRAARRHGERLRGGSPRIRLSTIHSAKGGEADHVILMTEMAKLTHVEMELKPDDERRVWYVGVTRAKRRLTVVGSETNRSCPWL